MPVEKRNFFRYVADSYLFREPRRSLNGWAGITFGLFGVSAGLFIGVRWLYVYESLSLRLLWVALGAHWILLMGAELLPQGWSRVAGFMRLGSGAVLVLGFLTSMAVWAVWAV